MLLSSVSWKKATVTTTASCSGIGGRAGLPLQVPPFVCSQTERRGLVCEVSKRWRWAAAGSVIPWCFARYVYFPTQCHLEYSLLREIIDRAVPVAVTSCDSPDGYLKEGERVPQIQHSLLRGSPQPNRRGKRWVYDG